MPRFNVDKEAKTSDQNTVAGSPFNLAKDETPKMSKEEANKKLSEMVAEVYAKLAEVQSFADEHNLGFSLDVEYGMGGYYEEGEWHPSSQSC